MFELDSGKSAAHEEQPETGRRAHASRRNFMRKVFFASGATAVATMGGAGAWAAMADDTNTAGATASAAPSGAPSGGPGGGAGGPGNQSITEEFFGLTTDGKRIDDLFTIHSTGVETAPVIAAANAFLAGLTDDQKTSTQFTVHSTEWRLWSNVDSFERQGVSIADLTDEQRALGTALLKSALSADGLETTEKIRKINQAAGEAIGNTDAFNEEAFFYTVMGTPSDTEPWGFQFDGHHLVINYFVLGDQVVMSPCFWGSEPTSMEIDGETVTVCHEEVVASLAFINSLTEAQQAVAIESTTKSNESMKAGAFSDNAVQAYTGLRCNKLSAVQKKKLLGIVEAFASRAKADVAKARMAEVRKHLDDTYVTWAGGIEDDSAFYVRVHSPVVWVEVDCQAPGPLAGAYGASQGSGATQMHVHSVIRTPNGNDYGKELLRQHYLTSPHHR
ncbi:DUF3500 domain-containing protein [Streptomyces heilongjiangensis]|uniref:DUF3500 domain-containing protein n=1 Tax=Streptomyces heilongjiangensis TaxID=945052 RepID=A0ABW1B3V0_9ACTN|nr:DUF3500 domain-containing protein [Streptomyces heilongjiangensis]MDC2945786.1 DUF3500 domain-containing protein [Streptomyces heilongjiangensis]